MSKETASIRQELHVLQRNAAWKYVGYPGLSRFMASSTDCFSVRAFSHLNVRVLLKLQNDIVKLESELMDMDVHSMNMPNDSEGRVQGGCGSFRLDESSPRGKLLDVIAGKLKDYNERLNQFLQLQDRPKSSFQQVRNLRLWLENHPDAIEREEREFLEKHDEDLLAVRTARRTRFGRWMETLGVSRIASMSGLASKDTTRYYDRGVWKSIGAFGVLFMLIVMLIGPMWALPFAAGILERLSIITSFILAFSLLITIGTTLSAFQRMIIIAGYSAQLVFALGLVPSWSHNTTMTGDKSEPTSQSPVVTSSTVATATASVSTSTSASTSNILLPKPSNAVNNQSTAAITPAAIAGIVIGIVSVIALAAALLFFCRRRHRRGVLRLQKDFRAELAATGLQQSDYEPYISDCTLDPRKISRNELEAGFPELPERRHLTLRIPGATARHDATSNRESMFLRSSANATRIGQCREEEARREAEFLEDLSGSERGSLVSFSNTVRQDPQEHRATGSNDDPDDCEFDDIKI